MIKFMYACEATEILTTTKTLGEHVLKDNIVWLNFSARYYFLLFLKHENLIHKSGKLVILS